MTHEDLYQAAAKAAGDLFADTGVSTQTTLASLRTLRGELDVLIDTAQRDLEFASEDPPRQPIA